MTSAATLILVIFLFFITITEGEKGKKIDKIVIHVPYKIHKHHHTHTKYKIITIPAPKKESTIIYLKDEIQPVKQIPAVQIQSEAIETDSKTPEPFIPPHQESASALLDSLANHKEKNIIQTDQEHYYDTIVDDQKPFESYSNQNTESFIPNLTFKPMLIPSHENLIPNFSFKPMVLPQQNELLPKLFLNPLMHHSYKTFLPKFKYQPMLHLPQGHLNFKYSFRPMVPPANILHDSAHTSSQVYNSVIPPRPKATSYKVKEENGEDYNMQMIKHQHTILNKVPLLPKKTFRKGKNFLPQGHNYKFKDTRNMIQFNPDYEYEHVGYLIIDGNSKKIVGKNFKDEIHLSS